MKARRSTGPPSRRSFATQRTSRVRSLVFAFPIVPRNYTRFDAANTRGAVLERPLISLSGLSAKSATPLGVRDSWAPCTHHPWQKLPYTVTRFCLLPQQLQLSERNSDKRLDSIDKSLNSIKDSLAEDQRSLTRHNSRAKCAREELNVDRKKFDQWMEWSEIANEQESMRQTIKDLPEEMLRERLIKLQDLIGPLPIDRFIKNREELADQLFELSRSGTFRKQK